MRGVGGTSVYSSAVIRIHVTAKKQRTDPARFRTFQQYRSSRRRRTAVAFAHWGTCVIETRDASDFGYGAVEGGVAITRFGALLICSTAEGRPSMDAWTALLNRIAFWRGTSSLGDRSIQNAYRSLGC